ncbi:hypothetical protein JOQ06_004366, partial [Pogonophryne albipinna]
MVIHGHHKYEFGWKESFEGRKERGDETCQSWKVLHHSWKSIGAKKMRHFKNEPKGDRDGGDEFLNRLSDKAVSCEDTLPRYSGAQQDKRSSFSQPTCLDTLVEHEAVRFSLLGASISDAAVCGFSKQAVIVRWADNPFCLLSQDLSITMGPGSRKEQRKPHSQKETKDAEKRGRGGGRETEGDMWASSAGLARLKGNRQSENVNPKKRHQSQGQWYQVGACLLLRSVLAAPSRHWRPIKQVGWDFA